MSKRLIDHIGILVTNLEESIERWEKITGYTFSPIARYRSHRYSDLSNRDLHFHDARIAFSREGRPRIELLEVTGEGTHSARNLGVHHLAFVDYDDLEAERERITQLGFSIEGEDVNAAGELLLFFADPAGSDGARLEFVSPKDHPNVMDDGSPVWRNPATGRLDPWGPQNQ